MDLNLDPWQCLSLDVTLSRDANRWAAQWATILAGRQSGKTKGILVPLLLGDMFLWGQPEQVSAVSAHVFRTSLETFRVIKQLITDYDDLRAEVKRVSNQNGDEHVELNNGFRVMFSARTKSGARGLSGNYINLDEALFLTSDHLATILPLILAQPDIQIRLFSSAPLSDSEALLSVQADGRAAVDKPGRIAHVEFCDETPCFERMCDHAKDTIGCAYNDPACWERGSPAMQVGRISVDNVALLRNKLPLAEFAREIMGRSGTDSLVRGPIPATMWAALVGDRATWPVMTALGLAASWDDGGTQSVGLVAAGRGGDGCDYVEAVAMGPGTTWAVDWLTAHIPSQFAEVILDGRGPAAELISDLEAAGIPMRIVSTVDATRAGPLLVRRVKDDKLRHSGQPELADAVARGRRRDVGDGWCWRRRGEDDISLLEAASLAVLQVADSPADDQVY